MRSLAQALLLAPLAVAAAPRAPAAGKPPSEPAASSIRGMAPLPGNSNLLASNLPPIPASLSGTVQRWTNGRGATLLDASTDGSRLLVATRFGSTTQLHLVERPLGARTQLTFGEEPVSRASFLPQDPEILFFLRDVGGGEFYQVYRLDLRTQTTTLLTDGKSRHEALLVSHEGRRLAWSGTDRNGKDSDVYVADADDPQKARRVTETEGAFYPLDFSPAARQLLVVQQRSINDADLWLVNVETREKRRLTPPEGKGSVVSAAFSADGRAVYLSTNRYADYDELVRIELDALPGTQPRSLTRGIHWSVGRFAVAHDTGAPFQVAVVVNQDGYDRVYLVEPGTGQLEPVALPTGVINAVRFPERKSDVLAFSVATARAPSDVFQLDLRTRKLSRWTRSELGPLDPSALVEPELVRYRAKDGLPIPAFVYRPRGGEEEKHPALVLWHGGPEAQARPDFVPFVQMLVNELGLVVVAPNVRGSAGYGKAYLAMDDGVAREKALGDISATVDWLSAQPDVDPDRLGAYGGSYGGYMTLASVAFEPRRFKAAVDVVGISNLATFLEHTQAYRRDLRRAEYGDERVPEVRAVLERISPLNRVRDIQAALFVVQGRNDPRVPQSESEQIVRAVRASGHDAWYLLGLNEGHGFQKKENRDALDAAVLLFLRDKLVKNPRPPDKAAQGPR